MNLGVLRALMEAVLHRRSVATRYVAVSVLNVVNHQILLALANSGWGWSAGWANVFAAAVAAVPAYLLSRRWVWQAQGAHSLRAEVLPFWTIALLGLVVSSLLAEGAEGAFGSGVPVALASIAGYLVVWVLKFLVLEKLFTRAAAHREHEKVTVP